VSWDSRRPEEEPFDLPILYLSCNGQPAPEADRTLTLTISGVAGGTQIEVEIVSWHESRANWERHRQTEWFALPERACSARQPCVVRWPIDADALSDYYRLTIRDEVGETVWENPESERPDLVALDTWEVGLDGHVVRVLYACLFPFAPGERALYHRLTPDAVPVFISKQFIPIVVETWRTQFGDWGFGPIHPTWDADKVVEVIFTGPPFALFGGTGTYTASTYADGSPYPERRIWLQPCHNTLQAYDSLENGFRVIYAHEFFHTAQWNVLLWTGCPARKWVNVFVEAQAMVASSVQYPELELSAEHLIIPTSEYCSAASRFLEHRLKVSWADMEAEKDALYDAALYWRFLYEQAGGMRVLRAGLEEMACRPVDDVASTLYEVMDAALARSDGPRPARSRWTFEESLAAFACANYALRLKGGRCATADLGACGGLYYDPHGMYAKPAVEASLSCEASLAHGTSLTYAGAIPASFGTDFVEVSLGEAKGRPVEIVFRSDGARFDVQVWRLSEAEGKRQALTAQPERLAGDCSVECGRSYSGLALAQVDRLALIVVRVDPYESVDPLGTYHLSMGLGDLHKV
jgi:hypothetical protein